MAPRALPDPAFWRRQRVFLTGHTGFKGGWLAVWLHRLGAAVHGYALSPATQPALFDLARVGTLLSHEIGDIGDAPRLTAALAAFAPTVVIHMAAQPLVRLGYAEPVRTFATNVLGTVNVMEAARAVPGLGAVLIVTSDKCYDNAEHGRPFRESDPLGGRDPYSASKAGAEIAVAAYFWSFFRHTGCGLGSGRAGNVLGGGDWAADRLLPDLVRAFAAGDPAVLRNPAATRPWQHVLEPLAGYLLAIERLFGRPGAEPAAWNFGPDADGNRTVGDIAAMAAAAWGDNARIACRHAPEAPQEAGLLSLDSGKARAELGWSPTWDLPTALRQTIAWYRAVMRGADALHLCRQQIDAFAGS